MPFRTHNFSLRLTDQEIASYEALASENGVSVSEWARGVLNERVRREKQVVGELVRKEWIDNG